MSETFGTAKIKWQISSKADFVLKPFWIAINDFTPEQFAENPVIKLDDARQLIGEELLVHIGTVPSQDGTREYKNVVDPFAFPLNRYQGLSDAGLIR